MPETSQQDKPTQGAQTGMRSQGEGAATYGGKRPVRFLHAADLHLAAAFQGISGTVPTEAAHYLRDATFMALERLFALAEKERPDFVLLAGDIYNQEDYSVRAQLAVHAGCQRLEKLGIPVCIVHGNHDPLSSRLQTLTWPANVSIFGEELGAVAIKGPDEQLLAIVHGISYASARETRNLAARFARGPENCLHIGLLHTTAADREGQSRYAPCSLEDFTTSGLDYWALGHVHQHKVLCENPLVQYPGALQGLHINETGAHGCLMVTAFSEGRAFRFETHFCPLSPAIWLQIALSLDEDMGLDTLETAMKASLAKALQAIDAAAEPGLVLARFCLGGRSMLDGLLRKGQNLADLLERLREDNGKAPLVWVKDIELGTRNLADAEALLGREDLLGEVWRMAESIKADPEALAGLADTPLGELYADPKARKVLEKSGPQELVALLADAQALCLDLLESE